MSTMRDEIDKYIKDYRAADKAIRNGKREVSLFKYYKWEAIRAGIREIDLEEASG